MAIMKQWSRLRWPYCWRVPDKEGEYEVADENKKLIANGFGNLKEAAEKYLTIAMREKRKFYFRHQTSPRIWERGGNWIEPLKLSQREIMKIAKTMKGYFPRKTISDFIKLSKNMSANGILITSEFSKLEALILLALAKNCGFYNDAFRWAQETKAVGKTVLGDAKKNLVELGVLHEETIRNGAVGRPRKRLYLAVEETMN